MYALLDDEQTTFSSAVRALAQDVGLDNPSDLGDRSEAAIWDGLRKLGLLELRERGDEGAPLGNGVYLMVAAQELGARLVPVPFIPSAVLAPELLHAAAAPPEVCDRVADGTDLYAILLGADLREVADTNEGGSLMWGGAGTTFVLGLRRDGDGASLLRFAVTGDVPDSTAIDLTQGLRSVSLGEPEVLGGHLDHEALDQFRALALTTLCADTVGTMRRALDGAVQYSKERVAFGAPIGSFQAIQHLAAESLVMIEGAYGATCFAAWSVDEALPAEALLASRTAKAYCATVGRTVTENVMQIYGGIGQTWEHIAHFYTRRAVLNSELMGAEGYQLECISDLRLPR